MMVGFREIVGGVKVLDKGWNVMVYNGIYVIYYLGTIDKMQSLC